MKNQTSHYSGYLIFAVPAQWKTKEKDVKTCTRNENTNILSCSVLSLTFWQWYFWDIVIWTGKFRMKYTLTKIQDLTFPRFPIFLLYLSEIQSLLPGKEATSCLAGFLEKNEICISGEIYSSRHFKSFKVEKLKLSIEFDQKEKSKILKIAGVQCQKWLEEKYKEELRGNSIKNNEVIINRLKR